MCRYFIILSMITLSLVQFSIVLAATQISGTVTAKRGDSLKVEFQPHETVTPRLGDMVDFSLQLDGVKFEAGIGKVTKIDENFVWVQTSDKRPDLTMNVVIHATGFSRIKATGKSNLQKLSSPRRGQELKWRRIKLGKSLTLGGDYFNAGQSTLDLAKMHHFDGIVEQLQREPYRKIRIVGHTDATGSASANKKLSEKRAIAVRNVLVAQGVGAERLTTLGLGETMPIETNATREGRSKNRRVEIIILEE